MLSSCLLTSKRALAAASASSFVHVRRRTFCHHFVKPWVQRTSVHLNFTGFINAFAEICDGPTSTHTQRFLCMFDFNQLDDGGDDDQLEDGVDDDYLDDDHHDNGHLDDGGDDD